MVALTHVFVGVLLVSSSCLPSLRLQLFISLRRSRGRRPIRPRCTAIIFGLDETDRFVISLRAVTEPLPTLWQILLYLCFPPFTDLGSARGGEDVGHSFPDVAHLLALALRGTLAELRNLGHDETALCLGQVGLLEIVQMGWDNVLLPVDEPITCCLLRLLVDVIEHRVHSAFGLAYLLVVGLNAECDI